MSGFSLHAEWLAAAPEGPPVWQWGPGRPTQLEQINPPTRLAPSAARTRRARRRTRPGGRPGRGGGRGAEARLRPGRRAPITPCGSLPGHSCPDVGPVASLVTRRGHPLAGHPHALSLANGRAVTRGRRAPRLSGHGLRESRVGGPWWVRVRPRSPWRRNAVHGRVRRGRGPGAARRALFRT